MIRFRTALLLALLPALPASARAQEAAPGSPLRPLTLEQARERAMEGNPAYRQAENSVVSARAGVLASRSQLFLPSLQASIGTNGSLQRSFSGTDDFGRPIRRDDPLRRAIASWHLYTYLILPAGAAGAPAFGRLAPYLLRACKRPLTPSLSSVPRTM